MVMLPLIASELPHVSRVACDAGLPVLSTVESTGELMSIVLDDNIAVRANVPILRMQKN